MPPKKITKKPAAPKTPHVKPEAKKPVRIKAAVKKPAAAEVRPVEEAAVREPEPVSERYWEAVGRRKTAVARVRLFARGDKGVWVNGKPLSNYFPYPFLQQRAAEALETMNSQDRFRTSVKVSGGGINAQADAIRHGTARALILFNPDFRKRLKKAGFLTRDPRMKERKKFGLKGARRAPQWAKR